MSNNERLIRRFQQNPFQEGLHHLYVLELVFAWFQTLSLIKPKFGEDFFQKSVRALYLDQATFGQFRMILVS